MNDINRTLGWCRAERLKMIGQLDTLKAGGLPVVRLEKAIADLDKLLAQLERRASDGGE